VRAVVVGAGITGLAAAWELRRLDHDVVVLEHSSEVGGKLVTGHLATSQIELGPDSFLTRTPAALELVDDLDLELLAPSASQALLFRRGERRAIPPGLVLGAPPTVQAALASPLVGPIARLRAAWGVLARSRRGHESDDLGHIAAWRWGGAWVRTHIEPLVGGINANTVLGLSARVSAPNILDLPPSGPRPPRPAAAGRPAFLAPRGGLGELVAALRAQLVTGGVSIETNHPAAAIEHTSSGLRVISATTSHEADLVVVATPAFETARLLAGSSPEAAALLRGVRYASVSVLGAELATVELPEQLRGVAGVLVAREEGLLSTAVTLASEKWPHWSPEGRTLLRISTGSLYDHRHLERDEEALTEDLLAEASGILGLELKPVATQLTRWQRAFPHFPPWHQDLVARLDALVLDTFGPQLALAGAWRGGSGIPTCIASGRAAAARALEGVGA